VWCGFKENAGVVGAFCVSHVVRSKEAFNEYWSSFCFLRAGDYVNNRKKRRWWLHGKISKSGFGGSFAVWYSNGK